MGSPASVVDIRAATDVLLAVVLLVAIVSGLSLVTLLWDWASLLFSPTSTSPITPRTSSKTLKLQSILFSILAVALVSVLIPTTIFVRVRHAKVFDGNGVMVLPENLEVDTTYWAYGFIRCLAAAPWFTFIAFFPTTTVTIFASKLRQVDEMYAVNETLEGGEKGRRQQES